MNLSVFSGNLTRDPDVRSAGSGKVANFTVAVNRSFKSGDSWKEETAFVDFEAWDALADVVVENAKKGTGVIVSGLARTQSWSDKDGNKRSKLVFRMHDMGLLLRRKAASTEPKASPESSAVADEVPF